MTFGYVDTSEDSQLTFSLAYAGACGGESGQPDFTKYMLWLWIELPQKINHVCVPMSV